MKCFPAKYLSLWLLCIGAAFAQEGLITLPLDSTKLVKPGFDCTKATTKTEKVICASPDLSSLDNEMGALFRSLKAVHPAEERKWLGKKQRQWLDERDRCEKSAFKDCLLNLYKKRILELINDHLDAYSFDSEYCEKDCPYPHSYKMNVEDVRIGDILVEYLVSYNELSYGLITANYYIGIFNDDSRIQKKERRVFAGSMCKRIILMKWMEIRTVPLKKPYPFFGPANDLGDCSQALNNY